MFTISSLQVIRKSTGTVVFSIALPGLIYSEQFIQVPISLPSGNIYGLGENFQMSYRHDLSVHKTWVGFAR